MHRYVIGLLFVDEIHVRAVEFCVCIDKITANLFFADFFVKSH